MRFTISVFVVDFLASTQGDLISFGFSARAWYLAPSYLGDFQWNPLGLFCAVTKLEFGLGPIFNPLNYDILV